MTIRDVKAATLVVFMGSVLILIVSMIYWVVSPSV
jgi:hypothetical protein